MIVSYSSCYDSIQSVAGWPPADDTRLEKAMPGEGHV
jgi:hypothetical protein